MSMETWITEKSSLGFLNLTTVLWRPDISVAERLNFACFANTTAHWVLSTMYSYLDTQLDSSLSLKMVLSNTQQKNSFVRGLLSLQTIQNSVTLHGHCSCCYCGNAEALVWISPHHIRQQTNTELEVVSAPEDLQFIVLLQSSKKWLNYKCYSTEMTVKSSHCTITAQILHRPNNAEETV